MRLNEISNILTFNANGLNMIRWGSRDLLLDVVNAVCEPSSTTPKELLEGSERVLLAGRDVAEQLRALPENHALFNFFSDSFLQDTSESMGMLLGKAVFEAYMLRSDVLVCVWVKDGVIVEHVGSYIKSVAANLGLRSFQCHKIVQAAKIEAMSAFPGDGPTTLHLENNKDINVSQAWMQKHSPVTGGYFVLYNDGYTSFSPADAFEDGYSRI